MQNFSLRLSDWMGRLPSFLTRLQHSKVATCVFQFPVRQTQTPCSLTNIRRRQIKLDVPAATRLFTSARIPLSIKRHRFSRFKAPPASIAFNFVHTSVEMSAAQDLHSSSNGGDIADAVGQLKIDDRVGPDGEPAPKTDEEYAQAQLTLRAIVSSKEAGVIIGKGGKNVADLRDETGVKAGVSKVVQGVHDRVLTITGGCDAISRAYAIVARALLEGAPAMGMGGVVQSNGTHRTLLSI